MTASYEFQIKMLEGMSQIAHNIEIIEAALIEFTNRIIALEKEVFELKLKGEKREQ